MPAEALSNLTDIIQQTGQLLDVVSSVMPKVIAVSAVAATFVPQAKTGWLGKLRAVVDLLGCNFGNAANAKPDPDAKP